MKNLIKILYILAFSLSIISKCQISKAAETYQKTGEVKPPMSLYARAYGLPLMFHLPLLGVTALAARYSSPVTSILSMQATLGMTSVMAYWGMNRADRALKRQELNIQQELARHYALSKLKEDELAAQLNRLNLLTENQKRQIQARALDAQELFQSPIRMALVSNA